MHLLPVFSSSFGVSFLTLLSEHKRLNCRWYKLVQHRNPSANVESTFACKTTIRQDALSKYRRSCRSTLAYCKLTGVSQCTFPGVPKHRQYTDCIILGQLSAEHILTIYFSKISCSIPDLSSIMPSKTFSRQNSSLMFSQFVLRFQPK
jgi:hypothetical protein